MAPAHPAGMMCRGLLGSCGARRCIPQAEPGRRLAAASSFKLPDTVAATLRPMAHQALCRGGSATSLRITALAA
jgi:hypothetical protein